MTMHFRYKSVKRPDGTSVKAPMIPVTLKGERSVDTVGLLDSGADISAISRDMAEILGLDLEGEEDFAFGIAGKVKTIETTLKVFISQKHERYNFDLPIKIILDDYSSPLLLGRAGFFENFVISFDELNEKIGLKKVDKRKVF